MKPIVSFTLFGTQMKYYVGAEKNIEDINRMLPEWEVRIYYHSDFILTDYLEKLKILNVNLVDVKDIKLGEKESIHFPYFWRFLSFLEDAPSIVRDLDSRFSEREVSYINSWINSDKDYFIIRDHPWHSPVPSGLFGIKKKIEFFENHMIDFISNNELIWGTDQTILQFYMEKIDMGSVFYCGYDDQTNYIPRDDINFFIGMQIDENNNPMIPSAIQALDYLNAVLPPVEKNEIETTNEVPSKNNNMKYCFSTLSIGAEYEIKTIKFYLELASRTTNCDFFITTTNKEFPNLGERFKIKVIDPPSLHHESVGTTSFNYNLKSLSLKNVVEYEKQNPELQKYEYIIFSDADWTMYEGFSEEKVFNMLNWIKENDYDFVFERPARIGDSRAHPEGSFFRDKIYDYDILEYDKWDEGHCANEQFMIFKNSYKFRFFVQRWEQFLWYSIQNKIRNYAEGFEIGVSALEAGMKWHFEGAFNHFLQQCFQFHTKQNQLHIRF
jgi:hypothetical protein